MALGWNSSSQGARDRASYYGSNSPLVNGPNLLFDLPHTE
jgi:hypothetical protein